MRAPHRVFLALSLLACGCVRHYSQPELGEPHADVQIRVIHHTQPGPMVDELVSIDGEAISFAESQPGVRSTTLRVRPQPTRYGFETTFFHEITQWVPQTYYTTRSYQCGYGRWCTQQVPQTRMVAQAVRVPDAQCAAVLDQAPLAGGVYLVQYEFMSAGVCRATCQRLLAGSDGSLLATECGPGEPPTTGSIPDAAAQSARSSVGTSGGEATTRPPQSDEFGD